MKPTIGRIVHYTFPNTFAGTGQSREGQSRTVPAIIVAVWSDTCVNLRVFQDGEHPPLWKTSVVLKQSEDDLTCEYWEWPAIPQPSKDVSDAAVTA